MNRKPFRAALLAVSVWVASGQSATAQGEGFQASLPLTINEGFDSPDALRFDWPAVSVGTGQYEDGPTGATVIRFNRRAHVAMDARGGGPGTINSDYIGLGYPHAELDAIVLSGGTFYGLETATAVNTALLDDGKRSGAWDNIGVVLGSIIYDMGGRRLNEIYPDKRLAQAALRAAKPGVFPRGPYGGGRHAMAGTLFGCNVHSGQGAAYRQVGDIKVAVFTVVNALGVVVDREGEVVACNGLPGWPDPLRPEHLLNASPDSMRPDWDGTSDAAPEKRNTTISVVVTNREMSQVELNRLAVQVHTSMARAIQPFATEFDGDVLYAVSTAEVASGPGDGAVTAEIGMIAGELMWDAILSAIPERPIVPVPEDEPGPHRIELRALAGTYEFGPEARLRLWEQDGKLHAQAVGAKRIFAIGTQSAEVLQPIGESTFFLKGRYPLTILLDGQGGAVINPGRWQQNGKRLASN